VATCTSIPVIAAPTTNDCPTLLPSPTHATVASSPTVSRMVRRSASVWQGCASSVSPLMTGQSAYSARTSTSS